MKAGKWYEAENSNKVRAVLGVFKEQEDQAGESRKRRRVDDVGMDDVGMDDDEDYV